MMTEHSLKNTQTPVNTTTDHNKQNDQSMPLKAVMHLGHNRLPCRGCTTVCANFDRCGGAPWRMV